MPSIKEEHVDNKTWFSSEWVYFATPTKNPRSIKHKQRFWWKKKKKKGSGLKKYFQQGQLFVAWTWRSSDFVMSTSSCYAVKLNKLKKTESGNVLVYFEITSLKIQNYLQKFATVSGELVSWQSKGHHVCLLKLYCPALMLSGWGQPLSQICCFCLEIWIHLQKAA